MQLIAVFAVVTAAGFASREPGNIDQLSARSESNRPAVSALIVEPRCHSTLPLTVANMRASLPAVPIQVFYSARNRNFVEQLLPPLRSWGSKVFRENNVKGTGELDGREGSPGITLHPLPGKYYHSMNFTDYSLLLESPEFWDMVSGEKVLVFETDTWVCQNAEKKLQHWLQYDYVGAPWNHKVVGCTGGMGNGGFSLRSRQAMHDAAAAARARLAAVGEFRPPGVIAENRGRFAVLSEDIFFCQELERARQDASRKTSLRQARASLAPVMPGLAEADKFAEEERIDTEHGDPLGVHRPWVYEAEWWALKRSCPGLHFLHQAFNKPTGALAVCHKSADTEAVELLQNYGTFLDTRRIQAAKEAELRAKSWTAALQFSGSRHKRFSAGGLVAIFSGLHFLSSW